MLPADPATRRLLLCCSLVITLSMGIRHAFGLFLLPMIEAHHWDRETFSVALAAQNLAWGAMAPVAGWAADRYGAGRVVFAGAVCYLLGMLGMAHATTPLTFSLTTGLAIGTGLAGTTFSTLYGAAGRAVTPMQRATALAIVGAAGSFGQFLLVPIGQTLLSTFGWYGALLGLSALAALMMPLAFGCRETNHVTTPGTPAEGACATLKLALSHRSYLLLTAGFFVCGFQVVFIGSHLPAYLLDQGLSARTGMLALALIGLFNIAGTYGFGQMGGHFSKKWLLAGIYSSRSVVIALFLVLPLTPLSAALFACAIGLLWLGTVPLTNGIVAQVFGVRHLAMLSGIVFLSHQTGSFLGVWLGGLFYDLTGAYTAVWLLAVGLGILATLLHIPIDEQASASPKAHSA